MATRIALRRVTAAARTLRASRSHIGSCVPPAVSGTPAALTRSSGAPRFARCSAAGFHTSTAVAGRVVPFNLPDIGEGIAEVEIISWDVSVGDKVAEFDKLVSVQSDKASVDITSRYNGMLLLEMMVKDWGWRWPARGNACTWLTVPAPGEHPL